MFCYYHDQQFVGSFASKEAALLMLQAMLYKALGPGPYQSGIFDGTDKIVDSNSQELDLLRELGQIPSLVP